MPILIDGYNLLNAAGIFARGRRGYTLERARAALLESLAAVLPAEELPCVAIVFDAKEAPPGLAREAKFRGMQVLFAADHDEADDLIEEMIRAESSPRQLTVVSSDHRLQRAARRRKAAAIDSGKWYAEVLRTKQQRQLDGTADSGKPTLPLPDEAVADWLREFGPVDTPSSNVPAAEDKHRQAPKNDPESDDLWNPFPPGYAEDLFDDLADDSDDT